MSSSYDYDLIVIGAGSGGVRASRMATATGARVAVVEYQALGGTCVNVGCVPKKLFIYGAHYAEDFHESAGFGWSVDSPCFNWPTLRDNKTQEVKRLNDVYTNLLKKSGVELLHGKGSLSDAHTVLVNGKTYTTDKILLATGSKAFVPQFKGSEFVITSDDAFYLKEFPKKVIVVGGGYIAVEFASIFNGLGAETVLSYRRDLFLRGFDQDIRLNMKDELTKKNIKCYFNSTIKEISKQDNGKLLVTWNNGDTEQACQVMFATGRVPNTQILSLQNANIQTRENDEIIVNDFYQTSTHNIYAIGDVIGNMQLTPVAIAEAMHFVAHAFEGSSKVMDYNNIPTAVFTLPNIATVGLTEEMARKKYNSIDIYKSQYRHLKHTLSGSDEKTFMKIVVDKETDKVVGCHMIGSDAGEIIQGFAVAIKAGATKSVMDQTIGIHPSAAEEFVTMRTAEST